MKLIFFKGNAWTVNKSIDRIIKDYYINKQDIA